MASGSSGHVLLRIVEVHRVKFQEPSVIFIRIPIARVSDLRSLKKSVSSVAALFWHLNEPFANV